MKHAARGRASLCLALLCVTALGTCGCAAENAGENPKADGSAAAVSSASAPSEGEAASASESSEAQEALRALAKADAEAGTIAQGELRDTVFALVSSAENSTTDYAKEYGYIEDIDDGRGYTCGIIGFTSGTGDLLDVVNTYVALSPEDNVLEPFVPALEKAVGSETHAGLGDDFVAAWKKACQTEAMIEAQNAVLDEQYLLPAVDYAETDGLSPLGQYVYYDALVVHGPGSDEDSFGGIRDAALEARKPPAQGGSEADYLNAFLDARTQVMLKEEAHSDLSRIDVQRTFIKEGNWNLARPLRWTMYGDEFELK
ncbi:MAG: chitosanase [Adlercreutzia sp.]|nr:chitosanase [Adlercreutzia sp.]